MDHYRPTRYSRDSKQQRHHDQTIARGCKKVSCQPNKQPYLPISRHASPRGGFLFEIRSQRERTGESTADCADKTD